MRVMFYLGSEII